MQKILIDKFVKKGKQPTIKELQKAIFGSEFDGDSKSQNYTAYRVMIRGREKAREDIKISLFSADYLNELRKIHFERYDELEEVEKDENYKEYYNRVLNDRQLTAEEKEVLLDTAREHKIWYENKIHELLEEGHPFMIPDTAKKPIRWHLADDFHEISIRDEDIVNHFIKSVRTVLGRMADHKERLQDGRPVGRLLTQVTSVQAALEDGTSWECSHCTAKNPADVDICGVCGHRRN